MPLRIIITGSSTAISQVTKSILDRSMKDCTTEITDFRKLSLSAKQAYGDCAVINDLMADVYFRLPSALNGIPTILITNNERILKDPKRFGLFSALKNASGGAVGLAACHFLVQCYGLLIVNSQLEETKIDKTGGIEEPGKDTQ